MDLECPECGDLTTHEVLRVGGGRATVRCPECGATRSIPWKVPKPRELPVVVSRGAASRRASVVLGGDEDVEVETELIVDGVNVLVTGIETADGLRVDAARVSEVGTLWVKEYEEVTVGFAINLGTKTIAKELVVPPDEPFTVGEERMFDRLRVTIHAIKAKDKLHRKGAVEAGEIVRIFAKPTREAQPSRPRRTLSREERDRRKPRNRR